MYSTNNGSSPVNIKNKDAYSIDIKKIDKLEDLKWIEPTKLPKIAHINLQRNIEAKPGDVVTTFDPSSESDSLETIVLPKGIYLVHVNLNFDDPDDGFTDASTIVVIPPKE